MSNFPLFVREAGAGETMEVMGGWFPQDLAASSLTERKPKSFNFTLSIVSFAIFIWKKSVFLFIMLKVDHFWFVQLKRIVFTIIIKQSWIWDKKLLTYPTTKKS